MAKRYYEIWALGFDAKGFAIDYEVFLDEGLEMEAAIAAAERFESLGMDFLNHSSEKRIPEGGYATIVVEECSDRTHDTIDLVWESSAIYGGANECLTKKF